MWKIELSDAAFRDLSNLDKKTAQRIIKKLGQTTKNPQRHFVRLLGHDDYKLRVGDYRVLVLLLHESQTIFIQKIGHRKNVYK